MTMTPLFGFFNPSFADIAIILGIGVLLFGKRLPEVARSLGKGFVEFKKSVKGLEDDLDGSIAHTPSVSTPAIEPPRPPQRVATTAPKFQDNPANTGVQANQPPQV